MLDYPLGGAVYPHPAVQVGSLASCSRMGSGWDPAALSLTYLNTFTPPPHHRLPVRPLLPIHLKRPPPRSVGPRPAPCDPHWLTHSHVSVTGSLIGWVVFHPKEKTKTKQKTKKTPKPSAAAGECGGRSSRGLSLLRTDCTIYLLFLPYFTSCDPVSPPTTTQAAHPRAQHGSWLLRKLG